MKVYISADLEGVGGVVSYEQIDQKYSCYDGARRQMMKEVNAAIEGAFNGGASAVMINDAHDTMTNLQAELIDQRACLISGSGKPLSMMQGIEDHDVAIFLGYHARAGTDRAILDHTFSGKIYKLFLNNMEVGETGFNAAIAGCYSIPVVAISGDQALCAEALKILPHIETIILKEAECRTAARCLPLEKCCALIRERVSIAVAKYKSGTIKVPLLEMNFPVKLTIELITTELANVAALIPGVEKINGRTVEAKCSDMKVATRCFFSILRLIGGYEGKLI